MLTYDDAGSGPAVLLVHGHPFDRSMWRPQLALLPELGFRAIAPDLRGYGESPVTPGTVPFATHIADLVELLDALDVPSVVLCGLSMGGQLVMEFHRLHPDRVRGMVLADTTPHPETPESRRNRIAMADQLDREGMRGYADDVIWKMVSPNNPEVGAVVLPMMAAAPAAGAAAAQRGRADRPDYLPSLRAAKVPGLVVVGAEDEFTPVPIARETADALPNGHLVVVDGAAHMPNLERPEVFNAALTDFLNGLPAAQ
ncbi:MULTISPECIES: alpha/beta fold hydrolase [Actinokineospora]|uniref:Alpha/beta hydrolase n=1 Tax=Actinokineospora fastidiosa TaxID=1816 RepID=A0A918G3G5_9PSEU|nr:MULTISPECIES: alpha/beta fold hydrolase [Actinokineospora]UVS76874.1 AB hydrolase superfamily protein YdjP [Actinokineospora sp. UTMC 2448]GGS15193.1 alpha/beta hydrolase [Actinokineospora fastidiosa]